MQVGDKKLIKNKVHLPRAKHAFSVLFPLLQDNSLEGAVIYYLGFSKGFEECHK